MGSQVIYHEYTHNVQFELYGWWGLTGPMAEAFADYYGSSILNQSSFGEGIWPEPIRDLDNTIRCPDDLIGESHLDGAILGGALWDVRELLGAELTDALVMQTEKTLPNDFFEFLEALLIVDDDGDLNNGTPHSTEICDSFHVQHGIKTDYCIGYTSDPIAEIVSPFDGKIINVAESTFDIFGVVYSSVDDLFKNYTIEYGRGENPEIWNQAWYGEEQILYDLLGTTTLPDDLGGYTIRLTVNDSNSSSIADIYITTGARENWPYDFDDWSLSSPTVADLDINWKYLSLLITKIMAFS